MPLIEGREEISISVAVEFIVKCAVCKSDLSEVSKVKGNMVFVEPCGKCLKRLNVTENS